jgi:hypothetical protein
MKKTKPYCDKFVDIDLATIQMPPYPTRHPSQTSAVKLEIRTVKVLICKSNYVQYKKLFWVQEKIE